MDEIMERKYPLWIRGNKDNPSGVLKALIKAVPEFCDETWLRSISDENDGRYINASNAANIFYVDEYKKNEKIRLLDGCDDLFKEWLTTSSEWQELSPVEEEIEVNKEELMVGDLVLYKSLAKVCRIKEIYEDCAKTDIIYPVRYEEMAYIPITNDFLLKNGFKKQYDHDMYTFVSDRYKVIYWLNDADIRVTDKDKGLIYEILRMIDVRFVHQMQHLFKLYGLNSDFKV